TLSLHDALPISWYFLTSAAVLISSCGAAAWAAAEWKTRPLFCASVPVGMTSGRKSGPGSGTGPGRLGTRLGYSRWMMGRRAGLSNACCRAEAVSITIHGRHGFHRQGPL